MSLGVTDLPDHAGTRSVVYDSEDTSDAAHQRRPLGPPTRVMMSGISANDRISIRPARDDDLDAIIALGARCLGWNGDQRDRDFFRWKHHDNPFGRSPGWVAESSGLLVGFRTFLRWRFAWGAGRETLDVVRAVDTATDPDFQGRGIFRDLTMTAVEELTAAGVDAVFNTPNDQSRPGYLKMGWVELGRPTIRIRPLSLRGLFRIPASSRAAAELWPTTMGGSPVAGADLPEHLFPDRPTWRTERTIDFRNWRYRFEPLGYRHARGPRDGAVYRLRRRGAGLELSLCEVRGGLPALDADLHRADYALSLGSAKGLRLGVPIPRRGPVVTWRTLGKTEIPALADIDFCLGDVELF